MLGRVERKMVAGVADSYDIAERTGVVVDAESGRSFGRENREALERKRGRSVGEGKGDDKDARIELGVETFLAFFEAEVGGGAFSSSDILAVFL